MVNKLSAGLRASFAIIFWLAVWQLGALAVNNPYFLPDIPRTVSALINILKKSDFYLAVAMTLMRVVFGLLLGTLAGAALAIISHKSSFVMAIVSPMISVIKSTPVATFIILLWIAMHGSLLPVFVAFLMVMPIIWQNLIDAYNSISKELIEVADAFELTYRARAKLLIFPALLKYLIPAFITSSGLAWKSEIAAEIIAYTTRSIGQHISDARYNFDTPSVFAWTIVIILMSLTLEKTTKFLIGRWRL